MTEQLTLLSEVPASRRDDPPPSRAAEKRVTKSGTRATNQRRVLDAVKRWPGRTSKELAVLIGMDRVEVARRLGDLKNIRVWQGAARTCEASRPKRTSATTWWPTEHAAKNSHNDGADDAPTSKTA